MTDDLRYVKGLTRFNYWNYSAINPLDGIDDIASIAHTKLSDRYHKAHEAGGAQAIFTYVKADVWAFRARWVVQQIEDWRREDTDESRKKLHRLMRAYTDDRGRDSLPETVRMINRDQAIFKEITNLRQGEKLPFRSSRRGGGCFETVAKKYSLSVDGIEEIYKVYKRKADELMTGRRRPPAQKLRTLMEQREASKGREKPDWAWLEQHRQQRAKPRLGSWEEFFQWLDTMAERLDPLLRG